MYPIMSAASAFRRACDLFGVPRKQPHLADWSKEPAGGDVDEMLMVLPAPPDRTFWNTTSSLAAPLAERIASPFADWN